MKFFKNNKQFKCEADYTRGLSKKNSRNLFVIGKCPVLNRSLGRDALFATGFNELRRRNLDGAVDNLENPFQRNNMFG